MSGRIGILGALLALQLIIILAVLLWDTGGNDAPAGPLLEFDPSAVDTVELAAGGADEAVVLTRGEDGWRLPGGLPASSERLTEMLGRLASLEAGWAVATSGSAADRFEVSEDRHQRHIRLLAGGEPVAELYLGTSPGFQRVHARRPDDPAIYSVPLSNYELPAAQDEWLDEALLQPRGAISEVVRPEQWRLVKDGEAWRLDGGGGAGSAGDATAPRDAVDDDAVDRQAAEALRRQLGELRVSGIAGAPGEGWQPAGELRVTDSEGGYHLRLFADAEASQYRVASDRLDGYFELPGYVAEQLLVDRSALLAAAEPDTAVSEGAGSPAAEAESAPERQARGAKADTDASPG